MPFRSEKQRRYMWANHPDIAREWTDKYGSKPVDDDVTMEAKNQRIQKKKDKSRESKKK
jgi:hypothetical protein